MSQSTGPIVAVGLITLGNETLLLGQDLNPRIIVATGVAAGGLYLIERLSVSLAVGIAWIALITVLFARVIPGHPAPMENLLTWWKKGASA